MTKAVTGTESELRCCENEPGPGLTVVDRDRAAPFRRPGVFAWPSHQ